MVLQPLRKKGTMSYRNARIPIRTKDGIEYRDGYKFDACFSDGQLFKMGVYKSHSHKKQWNVSDINTGLAVCYGRTRVDAVKRFQDVYLSKFERIVSTDNYKRESAEFRFLTEAGK